MNWYNIFYWLTVADSVKSFFDVFSNIFTILSVVSLIIMIFMIIAVNDSTNSEESVTSIKWWLSCFRRIWIWCMVMLFITWAGYVFTPSKKDAMVIIAGGAVGNFITKDTSARQIPAEIMTLLRDKIRSEIREVNADTVTDTLASKSKEELIDLIKNKK